MFTGVSTDQGLSDMCLPSALCVPGFDSVLYCSPVTPSTKFSTVSTLWSPANKLYGNLDQVSRVFWVIGTDL